MFQEEEEGWTEENGGWNQNEEYIMVVLLKLSMNFFSNKSINHTYLKRKRPKIQNRNRTLPNLVTYFLMGRIR